jgi:hypothetical protein
MEGSFRNINEDRRNREILFTNMIQQNDLFGETAANMPVRIADNVLKPLKDITIEDDEDLFDIKVELLAHFINIIRPNTYNLENEIRYDQNTGKVSLITRHQRRPQSENRTVFGRLTGGAMVNQKVKKCEKKKVVLGKERCIYKVSGSKKDYMKYKGKLVPVSDYVKSMKKKN